MVRVNVCAIAIETMVYGARAFRFVGGPPAIRRTKNGQIQGFFAWLRMTLRDLIQHLRD
jgi:hypothetical protein